MPRDAARFLGDEAESYDEQSGAERDGSTERHNRSLNQRTRMRKQFVVVAMLLMISAAVLLAHDLFLKLDNYFVPPNTASECRAERHVFQKRRRRHTRPAAGLEHGWTDGAASHCARILEAGRRHDMAQRADRSRGTYVIARRSALARSRSRPKPSMAT